MLWLIIWSHRSGWVPSRRCNWLPRLSFASGWCCRTPFGRRFQGFGGSDASSLRSWWWPALGIIFTTFHCRSGASVSPCWGSWPTLTLSWIIGGSKHRCNTFADCRSPTYTSPLFRLWIASDRNRLSFQRNNTGSMLRPVPRRLGWANRSLCGPHTSEIPWHTIQSVQTPHSSSYCWFPFSAGGSHTPPYY